MANQENTRTSKQDMSQKQPPQQAQTGANEAADTNTGRPANKDPRFAPGQSPRQSDRGGDSRH